MKTYPAAPPTRLETWLYSLDGPVLAALVIGVFVVICAACMVPSIVARLGRTEPSPITRPVSSNRKAGRVRS